MSETVSQAAAPARIPEGFSRPGCVTCKRIARIDLSRCWRVDADTAFDFPGHGGHTIIVPAEHPGDLGSGAYRGLKLGAIHAHLAGYAANIAAERGLGRYDLIISEKSGHPYAKIVLQRHAWMPWRRAWLARFVRRNERESN